MLRALVYAVIAALAAAGCADRAAHPGDGYWAQTGAVVVTVPWTTTDMTDVRYEVTGERIASALTGPLVRADGGAHAVIEAVPAGEERVITVRAFAGDDPICEGADVVDVPIAATAEVTIELECPAAGAP